jgi:hypothetical protein
LRADLQTGLRFTKYGAVLLDSNSNTESPNTTTPSLTDDPNFDPFRVEGPPTQRWLASSRLQFSGPQIGKSFLDNKVARYSGDIKHILEPVIAFTFNTKNGLTGIFPRFDETDTNPGVRNSVVGERSVEFMIKQHLFGRPDSNSTYIHIARANLSIKYHFDSFISPGGKIKQGWTSIKSDIDIEPSRNLRLSYKYLDSEGSTDRSISTDLALRESTRFNLAFFTAGINQLHIRQRGIKTGGLHCMLDDKLRFQFEVNYDFERKTFTQSQVALAYVGPCVAYSIRYYHIAISGITLLGKEDRVDFALNLRNLGELFSSEIGGMFSKLFK